MIKKLPDKKEIERYKEKNVWDLLNKVLYDLCDNFSNHDKDEEIIAKVWLIGRSYAAAIERRNKEEDDEVIINDDFYEKYVPKAFRKSNIDVNLKNLSKYKNKEMTKESLLEALKTHYNLMKKIEKITHNEKRSFCSKYLHFHLPNLFFIYDSRVSGEIGRFISRSEYIKYNEIWKKEKVDEDYAKFACKCFELKNKIKNEYSIELNPRELDNFLVEKANEKERKKL